MKIRLVMAVLSVGIMIQGYKYSQNDLDSFVSGNSCGRCNLENAPLEGVDYGSASAGDGSLYDANLKGANLSNANLSYINAQKANFFGATITGTKFTGTDLSGATWTNGKICADGSYGECK